jgi:hypothetical protein
VKGEGMKDKGVTGEVGVLLVRAGA